MAGEPRFGSRRALSRRGGWPVWRRTRKPRVDRPLQRGPAILEPRSNGSRPGLLSIHSEGRHLLFLAAVFFIPEKVIQSRQIHGFQQARANTRQGADSRFWLQDCWPVPPNARTRRLGFGNVGQRDPVAAIWLAPIPRAARIR